MIDEETLMKRIEAANEEMLSDEPEPQAAAVAQVEGPGPRPIDLWDDRRVAIRDQKPTRVRGASKKLLLDLDDLLERGIKQAYKKAIDDGELLREEGERQRARLVEQQYMQDWFYPTVDALIRLNSQEEVLASEEALEALDSLVLAAGGGSTNGYTSVYVSSLYEPVEGQIFTSDVEVRNGLRRINALCDDNQIRSAIAVASKLQQQIDMGQNRATPDDYALIQKIALRGQ